MIVLMDHYPGPSFCLPCDTGFFHVLLDTWLSPGLPPPGTQSLSLQHSTASRTLLCHKASGVQIHINPTLTRPLHCPKGSGHVFQRDIKLPLDLGTHKWCQTPVALEHEPKSTGLCSLQGHPHITVRLHCSCEG